MKSVRKYGFLTLLFFCGLINCLKDLGIVDIVFLHLVFFKFLLTPKKAQTDLKSDCQKYPYLVKLI